MPLNVVLVEPEIPQNTGNIVRTCAATGCFLHLVEPLGFKTNDRYLKRAGLDYWNEVNISYYKSIQELYEKNPQAVFYYSTTKAKLSYTQLNYPENAFLVFGSETRGLSEDVLRDNLQNLIRIPMLNEIRSLNLSNSVAIIVYEVLRQQGFDGMKLKSSYIL